MEQASVDRPSVLGGDYEWYLSWLKSNFRPDDALRAPNYKLQAWQSQLKKETAMEMSTTVPLLRLSSWGSPAWMYEPYPTGLDEEVAGDGREKVWWAATQHLWAAGLDDRYVDWTAPIGEPKYDRIALAQQRAAKERLAGMTRTTLGAILTWLIENWQKLREAWDLETPWGKLGPLILKVAKTTGKFIWDGIKWVWHKIFGVDEREINPADVPDFGPFAVLHAPNMPTLPLTRTGVGAYSLTPHPKPPKLAEFDAEGVLLGG